MFGLSIYQLIYTITTAPVYYLLPQIATLGLLGQCHKLRFVTSGRMCDGARQSGTPNPTTTFCAVSAASTRLTVRGDCSRPSARLPALRDTSLVIPSGQRGQ